METKIFTSLSQEAAVIAQQATVIGALLTQEAVAIAQQAAVIGTLSWAFGSPDMFKHWAIMQSIFETSKAAAYMLPEKTPRQWKMGIGFSVAIPTVWLAAKQIGYPIENFLLQNAVRIAVVTSTTGVSKVVEAIADRVFPNYSRELKTWAGFAIAAPIVWYTANALGYPIEKALFIIVALQNLNRGMTPQISKPVTQTN
ncbi:MAG: hypothetical protein K940chlam6_01095 [Chlamydiae bacterium]|nr:hypothetical protein [Chlamydiota bacterium]